MKIVAQKSFLSLSLSLPHRFSQISLLVVSILLHPLMFSILISILQHTAGLYLIIYHVLKFWAWVF